MIPNEGGNIFQNAEGQPNREPNLADVEPTLKWLEKITGLNLVDNMLGSTGIKPTSGDLDVAVDKTKVDKGNLVNTLTAWVNKNHPGDEIKQWIVKSGISVHFKHPSMEMKN